MILRKALTVAHDEGGSVPHHGFPAQVCPRSAVKTYTVDDPFFICVHHTSLLERFDAPVLIAAGCFLGIDVFELIDLKIHRNDVVLLAQHVFPLQAEAQA